MVTIIFGVPGAGKTALLTHLLNQYIFDFDYISKMQNEIQLLNSTGFNLTIPEHCVASNYPITFNKFGYSDRHNRIINPFKLGFVNGKVPVHSTLPFEVIGISEAQEYFNSRMSAYYPDWQSRFYEKHRHNNLTIFLECQRPDLIDVNVRFFCSFLEVVDLKIKTDRQGRIVGLVWKTRYFENMKKYEKYVNSGGQAKDTYVVQKFVADYNVFDLYDSQAEKPRFYKKLFAGDFDLEYSKPLEKSLAGFKEYQKYEINVPDGFYSRRSSNL